MTHNELVAGLWRSALVSPEHGLRVGGVVLVVAGIVLFLACVIDGFAGYPETIRERVWWCDCASALLMVAVGCGPAIVLLTLATLVLLLALGFIGHEGYKVLKSKGDPDGS